MNAKPKEYTVRMKKQYLPKTSSKNEPRWFRAKRYGWGWTPATWQGWAVVGSYVAFEVWDFFRLDQFSHSASDTIRPFLLDMIIATVVLIAIAKNTGETPRWRWGK